MAGGLEQTSGQFAKTKGSISWEYVAISISFCHLVTPCQGLHSIPLLGYSCTLHRGEVWSFLSRLNGAVSLTSPEASRLLVHSAPAALLWVCEGGTFMALLPVRHISGISMRCQDALTCCIHRKAFLDFQCSPLPHSPLPSLGLIVVLSQYLITVDLLGIVLVGLFSVWLSPVPRITSAPAGTGFHSIPSTIPHSYYVLSVSSCCTHKDDSRDASPQLSLQVTLSSFASFGT